jgi:fatty acid desaturase
MLDPIRQSHVAQVGQRPEPHLSASLLAERGSDFAPLRRQIAAARLLDRRYGHYAIRIVVTLAAYVGAWWVAALLGDSWLQLIVAGVLGVVFTQIGFLGHDGGHQQVMRSRRGNDVIGIVAADLLIGLSYGWWLDKHNRHHAKPNHEGHDPDIGDGVLAFTTGQVAARTGAVGRFIIRYQAWLFFPLLTLEGLNLHVASVRQLLTGKCRRYRRLELALFGAHSVGYLAAVFLLMPPALGIAFIGVHQAAFGLYMGCSFAPNHKGMPTFCEGEQLDFLRRQVLTSRNVRGGWLTDFALGGLNYQVEHHLFPNMPRPSLRRAQSIVRDYCREHHVPYTEVSLIASYRAALAHLHQLGEPLRRAAPTMAG